MNLNQALIKFVRPQLKLLRISSRNVTSFLFNNKYRNKLNENLKPNSLISKMSISSSAMIRQNEESRTASGNQNRLMLMDIPHTKFPSPFYLIIPYFPFQFLRMLLLDKSFNFLNFMKGAEQVMRFS
jgi:hypothetical protein